MSRETPDGASLSWRLAGLEVALAEGLPFFIEWTTPVHPGRSTCDRSVEPTGIQWVEVGGDPDRLTLWLGDNDLDIRFREDGPGPHRVGIGSNAGGIVLG